MISGTSGHREGGGGPAQLGVPGINGESSPYYMSTRWPGSGSPLMLPAVKLLVLLRDRVSGLLAHSHEWPEATRPSRRSRSAWSWRGADAGEGADDRRPDVREPPRHHNAYLARGRYVEQLERLEALVGRDRMHVIARRFLLPAPARPSTRSATSWSCPAGRRSPSANKLALPVAHVGELRGRLEEHFTPYDERLATWWDAYPSWRRLTRADAAPTGSADRPMGGVARQGFANLVGVGWPRSPGRPHRGIAGLVGPRGGGVSRATIGSWIASRRPGSPPMSVPSISSAAPHLEQQDRIRGTILVDCCRVLTRGGVLSWSLAGRADARRATMPEDGSTR